MSEALLTEADNELDSAIADLRELKGYLESFEDADSSIDENRVEQLTSGIHAAVCRHNDHRAEAEMLGGQ